MKYKTLKLSDIKKKPSECSCGTADYHLATCPQVTTNNKKIEEILSDKMDMLRCLDCHKYFPEKCESCSFVEVFDDVKELFQAHINSLLQEIEDEIIKQNEPGIVDTSTLPHKITNEQGFDMLKAIIVRNELRQQQRKALKTIKERYLLKK